MLVSADRRARRTERVVVLGDTDRVTDQTDDQPSSDDIAAALRRAGFVAAEEEAALLVRHAGVDLECRSAALRRRLTGEPLAWILGETTFCGQRITITPGVYVPREQSEALAQRAVDRLPPSGRAIEICTGSGAIAATLLRNRPEAAVVATDIDPAAVECARSNGVDAYLGDLFAPIPGTYRTTTDLVVGVVPYVPHEALALLQRDTLEFESRRSYDGGRLGTTLLRRAIHESAAFLRPGGTLLLELGADQGDLLADDLRLAGFADHELLVDDEGDIRGLDATKAPH